MSNNRRYLKGAESADVVFNRWGLSSEHAKVVDDVPPYAFKFVEFIEEHLKRPKSREARTVEEWNRAWENPELPFPDDQIPHQPLEKLIFALEDTLRYLNQPEILFDDSDVGEVTIRRALDSRRLWEKAMRVIHDLSVTKRVDADRANSCTRIAFDIAKKKHDVWKD